MNGSSKFIYYPLLGFFLKSYNTRQRSPRSSNIGHNRHHVILSRFVKPKFYNTSLENAVQGIGLYPEYGDKVVTFNLLRSVATAPTRNAVDQT